MSHKVLLVLVVFILAALFLAPVATFAQDDLATNTPDGIPVTATVNGIPVEATLIATPEVPVVDDPVTLSVDQPTEPQPITVQEAWALIFSAITAVVAGGLGGAPLTAFVVGLAKHIPALDEISAPTLNLFVGGFLTAAWWIASHFGYQVQFTAASDFVLKAGPALLALLTTMAGASTLHKAARAENVPVFGYKRRDKPVLAPISEVAGQVG